MEPVTQIHKSKQPRRPHFIAEWAEARNMSQADLARELGADKSVISRWFNGTTPGTDWQERLAALFNCEPDSLFRDPHDDWLAKFFRDKTEEQKQKAIDMLKLLFDEQRTGTGG